MRNKQVQYVQGLLLVIWTRKTKDPYMQEFMVVKGQHRFKTEEAFPQAYDLDDGTFVPFARCLFDCLAPLSPANLMTLRRSSDVSHNIDFQYIFGMFQAIPSAAARLPGVKMTTRTKSNTLSTWTNTLEQTGLATEKSEGN